MPSRSHSQASRSPHKKRHSSGKGPAAAAALELKAIDRSERRGRQAVLAAASSAARRIRSEQVCGERRARRLAKAERKSVGGAAAATAQQQDSGREAIVCAEVEERVALESKRRAAAHFAALASASDCRWGQRPPQLGSGRALSQQWEPPSTPPPVTSRGAGAAERTRGRPASRGPRQQRPSSASRADAASEVLTDLESQDAAAGAGREDEDGDYSSGCGSDTQTDVLFVDDAPPRTAQHAMLDHAVQYSAADAAEASSACNGAARPQGKAEERRPRSASIGGRRPPSGGGPPARALLQRRRSRQERARPPEKSVKGRPPTAPRDSRAARVQAAGCRRRSEGPASKPPLAPKERRGGRKGAAAELELLSSGDDDVAAVDVIFVDDAPPPFSSSSAQHAFLDHAVRYDPGSRDPSASPDMRRQGTAERREVAAAPRPESAPRSRRRSASPPARKAEPAAHATRRAVASPQSAQRRQRLPPRPRDTERRRRPPRPAWGDRDSHPHESGGA
eukprot:TRINITY_DN13611_c0_g1_i1.p1 TRINITY_DN13611_c0_g1~~TRINITY_DN13611_c0_g1_i1.p1  ORF type:complete len:508 (+),score=222.10 TRINITY_DN13611_c0_g1_i1:76-1599(+)